MAIVQSKAFRIEVDADALPSWVPAPGTFANITTNSISELDPCPARDCAYCAVSGQNAVFVCWCGAAHAKDYGTHGALICWGGGHNGYYGNEVYAFDFGARAWVRHRNPSVYSGDDLRHTTAPADGTFPDGQPGPPHTYMNPGYMPAGHAGNARGKFVQFSLPYVGVQAQSPGNAFAFALDLDQANPSWEKWLALPFGRGVVLWDEIRQGWWAKGGGYGTKMWFVTPAGVITTYESETNVDGDIAMGYSPELDLFVVLGTAYAVPKIWCIRRSDIGVSPWKEVTFSGTHVGGGAFGADWVGLLGRFACYQGAGSNKIDWLTVPADPYTGTWQWTTETLTGAAGAIPSMAAAPENHNGTWGRFKWIPRLKSFAWCDNREQPGQLWRPVDT